MTKTITVEPLTISFGIKTSHEVTYGPQHQVGLMLEGYASRYGEVDQDGETQMPGSFASVMEEIVTPGELPIIAEHGADPALGMRRVGKCLEVRHDDDGLFVTVFVAKETADRFTGKAKAAFVRLYNNIKSGVTRGFSVGGVSHRIGKAIKTWNLLELSICNNPCLSTATFMIGAKALMDAYGDVPPSFAYSDSSAMDPDTNDDGLVDQADMPMLSRPAWSQAMSLTQTQGDESLHDHLLYREPCYQGAHNPESCPLCTKQRHRQGIKAAQVAQAAASSPSVAAPSPPPADGKKAALAALLRDRPDLLKAATELITDVGHTGQTGVGGKIGRRHSKKDKEVIGGIVALLQTHFGIGEDEDAAGEAAENAAAGTGAVATTS